MVKTDFKDLRKAAFTVGFGLSMGKFAARMVQSAISGTVVGSFKFAAKNGNEFAKEVCEKSKIDIEPKEENKEPIKNNIGFHCE